MEITEQTILQVERFIKKVAQKFPTVEESEASLLTDIHIRVSQDSGEMLAFDDDDVEITRCVVEQWIEIIDNLGLLKPYSFVLEDDDKQHLGELYLADDDTIILGGDLMQNLDQDLDGFLDELLKD